MGLFSGKRKAKRRAARLERIKARQSGKTSRAAERAEAKEAAYNAGIDPNAFLSSIVDDVTDTVQTVAAKGTKGGGYGSAKSGVVNVQGNAAAADLGGSLGSVLSGPNALPIIALAAYFLLKK